MVPYRRVRSQDKDTQSLQDAVALVFQDLQSRELIDGQIISGVVINGTKTVDHKLKRKPNGYLVIFKDADVNIWDSQNSNTLQASTLILNSSGPASISLWVF